ncbi:hypothetical protein AMELA_G00284250 [Ameiurus melas]|uniref:Uncharacterized protein n=1 Tax=Ameiurus melas TaxID=219545 RepID=A0A7J5ZIM5_AMEME|nr:hypothetical protein AMELA_G00284250 [Ameiurus melas]
MPSQRKKRQRRMRRLHGQWKFLEDQYIVTGKRMSGVCGVHNQPQEAQIKAQAKVPSSQPEVTSIIEPLTPQVAEPKVIEIAEVEAATEPHVSETETSAPEEVIAPKEGIDIRDPEEIRVPQQMVAPELREAPKLEAPEFIEVEILEDVAVSEVPSLQISDVMTPPKMEVVPEISTSQKISSSEVMKKTEVSFSEMTILEGKEAPENMATVSELTASKETLEVSYPDGSVPEIEAPVMEVPKVQSLEALDVTPPKMEAVPEVMGAHIVTATIDTLVTPEVMTPPQMFIPEIVEAPDVTESPKFTAGLEKIKAPEIVPPKLTACSEWSAPETVEAPKAVNVVKVTSNKELETSEDTKVPNVMKPQKLPCSEIKDPKVLDCDDLDVTEPDVILAPEMEAQETTADVPEVLFEVPINFPPEEPAVQENIISTA